MLLEARDGLQIRCHKEAQEPQNSEILRLLRLFAAHRLSSTAHHGVMSSLLRVTHPRSERLVKKARFPPIAVQKPRR